MTYPVVEQFLSVNGEGPNAGRLAWFIRLRGCNLNCAYCDTRWACVPDCLALELTQEAILQAVRGAKADGAESVTLTGGEPLLCPGVADLIEAVGAILPVEIETNGSVALTPFAKLSPRPAFTMDYKLPGSCMEGRMCLTNLSLLSGADIVKFVCASGEDLKRAAEIARNFHLVGRVPLYFSPVFGKLDPVEIVTFMKAEKLPGARLQLQLHKFIWPPEQRGV